MWALKLLRSLACRFISYFAVPWLLYLQIKTNMSTSAFCCLITRLPVRLSSKGKRKTGETEKSQELAEVVKLLRTVTGPRWSHLPHGAGLSLPLEQAMLRPPLRCTHPLRTTRPPPAPPEPPKLQSLTVAAKPAATTKALFLSSS